MKNTKPNISTIIGPTASSKSKIAIEIAKEISAEIISIDSVMIYKKMNIGSAKPTSSDMCGIKHHLIDIIEPWNKYSVNTFLQEVKNIIYDIHSRGKKTLLVGGTMMYIKSLIEGISHLPNNKNLRKKIKTYPIKKLHKFLIDKDPTYATKISCNDRYRIQRACEIMMILKKPYSQIINESKRYGGIKRKTKIYAILPTKLECLYQTIEKRLYMMIKNGFLEEVHNLMKYPQVNIRLNSMKSIGYKQAYNYITGKDSYKTFLEKMLSATKKLAKCQITWIKNWKNDINIINRNHKDILLKKLLKTD